MTNSESAILSGVSIRAAVRADAASIEGLAREVRAYVVEQRKPYFGLLVDFASSEPAYERAIADPDQAIFVAEIDSRVVGYIYCSHETVPDDLIAVPYVCIYELAVQKEMRESGIGNALMERVENWATRKGVRVIQLAVWEFNTEALQFYSSHGYSTLMRKMEKVL